MAVLEILRCTILNYFLRCLFFFYRTPRKSKLAIWVKFHQITGYSLIKQRFF